MWSPEDWQRISDKLESMRESMIKMQAELTARPALSPTSGGIGEIEKCAYLRTELEKLGLEIAEHRCPDPRVPCGYRPSLIAVLPGRSHERTIWIMTHVDIVPAGPRELWATDPFQTVVKDGMIYGRGVEDNQQEMVASIHALRALIELGLKPEYDVGLVLVADEETGSQYGIDYVLKQEKRFRPADLVLVPDAGNEEGSHIEIAEKSICWLKFVTLGKQSHGSTPNHGLNAHRAGAQLMLRIDKLLHERYPAEEPLYSPPYSTFEPTKKENNVPNINTIPGEDVFYFDCRVLPQYDIQEMLKLVQDEADKFAREAGVKVTIATEQCEQAAPPTPPDSPVVRALSLAVRDVLHVEPVSTGIGGGTVAAFFRRAGIPAAVWGRYQETAHQPNEHCLIDAMVGDALVYAHLAGQSD